MVKFSVIVPIYNVEQYLEECVDSVLAQTHGSFELILVDDGSPDRCPEICDSYAQKDNRVKVIHKENGGQSSARNAGIRIADGDYIVFLDSDDYWDDPDALSKIDAIISQKRADVVIWTRKIKGVDGQIKYFPVLEVSENEMEQSKPEVFRSLLCARFYVASSNMKAVKRDLFLQNDLFFEEGITPEDYEWSARLAIFANRFALYKEVFFVNRIRPDSTSRMPSEKHSANFVGQIIKCCELINGLVPGLMRDAMMGYAAQRYFGILAYIEKTNMWSRYIGELEKYRNVLNGAYTVREMRAVKYSKFVGLHLYIKIWLLKDKLRKLKRHFK